MKGDPLSIRPRRAPPTVHEDGGSGKSGARMHAQSEPRWEDQEWPEQRLQRFTHGHVIFGTL
jgi:hypothetical protein